MYCRCKEEDKDAYLYYILSIHGEGRTIVFCTSVAALRHLSSILRILGVNVWTLHAQMQQRARLKVCFPSLLFFSTFFIYLICLWEAWCEAICNCLKLLLVLFPVVSLDFIINFGLTTLTDEHCFVVWLPWLYWLISIAWHFFFHTLPTSWDQCRQLIVLGEMSMVYLLQLM